VDARGCERSGPALGEFQDYLIRERGIQGMERVRDPPLGKTLRSEESGAFDELFNARAEQVNTQIRLITRRGFGYHSPWAVIALAMLSLGGLCPPLPGR
jgi:hypothetical protein